MKDARQREPRMTRAKTVHLRTLVVGLTFALTAYCGGGYAEASDPTAGTWTGGGGLGFLGNTADGVAFALNLNAETFIKRSLSVGPLLQLGITGDLTQIGVSGQVKYWIDLSNIATGLKLTAQGGLGFVYTDFRGDDTSFLIPIGVGLDYALSNAVSATATFLLNFTDVDPGFGPRADVMPGLTFGLRFQ
jgi:hypothetical protein